MVQVPQVTNWSVTPKNGAEGYFTLMNTWIYESTNVINSYNQSIQKVNESIVEINAINQNVNTQAEQVTANTKTTLDATASASQSAKSASDSKLASLQSATNAKNEADRSKSYADSINPNDFIVPTPAKAGQVANKEYVDTKVSKTSASNNSVIVNDGNGGIKNSSVTIDGSGNLLLQSGTGALGYGTGAGGTVTQLTNKSTDVTLNKPAGTIIMSNSALASQAVVYFNLYNSLIGPNDTIIINMDRPTGDLGKYKIEYNVISGVVLIKVTNQAYNSYSDALVLKFTIVKGASS